MLQDILIKPTAMHWPATLVTVQLFTTLHDTHSRTTQKRLQLFIVVGSMAFFYQVRGMDIAWEDAHSATVSAQCLLSDFDLHRHPVLHQQQFLAIADPRFRVQRTRDVQL